MAVSFSLLVSSFAIVSASHASSDLTPPPSFFNCSEQGPDAFKPVVLRNKNGMTANMIAYGATMTHLLVPNKMGGMSDVLLGWDDPKQYCENAEHTYFGATIGRIANRIAKCEFELGGKTYKLGCNEKDFDTLHGGVLGFDRRVWTATQQTDSSVTWSYLSPDGEMGFPGNLHINVTHTITEGNAWKIEYSASTDSETVVAMTNHAYFNLNANVNNTPRVLEHVVTMKNADSLQEVSGAPDYHLIPTGKVNKIGPGSAWDFSSPKTIGKDIDQGDVSAKGGYDNAWIFSDWTPGMPSREVLTVSSDLTGISLVMYTDQPSVQLYTGNSLNGTDGNSSSTTFHLRRKASQSYGDTPQYYHYRGAFTLEAQQYIDAVNHPNFPSVALSPGQFYQQSTSYEFHVSSDIAIV